MRITVDPTLTVPAHALSKSQIRRVLSVVPVEWRKPIKSVRLSNALHSGPAAEYSFVSHRLTVHSRGRTEHDVIRDILMELLLHYTMTHPTPLSRLAEAQRKRLNREVEPLLEKALHEIKDA
jgi:hypothetical protein